MARLARKESATKLYHVTMRGNSKQNIFESNIDRFRFLNTMKKYCEETESELLVYCLMSNHVHLLVCAEKAQLAMLVTKICDSYTYFYNKKYERTGSLFQGRFGSRPIEDERDLFSVIRYILNNPVKAGMCRSACQGEWTSYDEYITGNKYCEAERLLEMVGGRENFERLMSVNDEDDKRVAIIYDVRVNDAEARKIVAEVMKGESVKHLASYPRETRDEYLRVLKSKGISIRQLVRLTGLGKGVIQRA